jgi:hypothetical protein
MKSINIPLSRDEAIVLFDYISRLNTNEGQGFNHQAEQRILWDIEAELEKQLSEVLHSNYKEILNEARSKVSDK